LSIGTLKIEYSADNFATTHTIATGQANDGSYSWTIPTDALSGTTIKVRITDESNSVITDTSDDNFRIRGGFVITTPNGGESLLVNASQKISWQTKGTIPKINLHYSADSGTTWNLIASSVDNTNSYNWTIPDVKSSTVKVRVTNPDDSTVTDESDAVFSIGYATVQFKVLDYDTLQHLADFNASEPTSTGWEDSGLNSPLTRTAVYPYGTYTTFFTKTNYIDNSVTWTAPKTAASTYYVTCYLENKASAQVTWQAILTYSFSPADDTLTAVGSLQRKGKLVGTNELERADMGTAILTIYKVDGKTVRNTIRANTINESGMYNFSLTNTDFAAGSVYPATLTITYRGRDYTSSANIDVGTEILQYDGNNPADSC